MSGTSTSTRSIRSTPVRGEDWVARLAGRIQLSDRPVYELFTGLPGSGKSTELRRLVQRLQANHGLLPVLIDGEDAIDLSNPIDVPDIYFAILYHTDAEVLELEGKSAAGTMQESYLTRFWNWITTTDINFKQAEFAVADKAKLVVELKDLRRRKRGAARAPRGMVRRISARDRQAPATLSRHTDGEVAAVRERLRTRAQSDRR
jgi:hypothetical protein